jgi:hypothetical protein
MHHQDSGPYYTTTGRKYPHDEYTQDWDRGMAIICEYTTEEEWLRGIRRDAGLEI